MPFAFSKPNDSAFHYLSPDRVLITFSSLMPFITFPNLIEADLRAPDRTLLINSRTITKSVDTVYGMCGSQFQVVAIKSDREKCEILSQSRVLQYKTGLVSAF